MTVFVLDNSVTMRWCFDSGTHAYADAILQELTRPGCEAIVPILWRYEVSSVLARAQNVGMLAPKIVAEFLEIIAALPIAVDEEGSRRILSDVHHLAITHRLTSYDAAYLELAQRRGLPMATLDAKLIAACAQAGITAL